MSDPFAHLHCLCPPDDCPPTDAAGRPLPPLFHTHRLALFRALSTRLPFAHWQETEEGDIDVMLLDWAAYVLDNLSFYNDQWTREQHLATAIQENSLRQLATLTGYQPRPNLASRAELAVIADATAPVEVASGLAIASEGTDSHPALPYETKGPAIIDPALNALNAIPPRETTFDPDFVAISGAARNLRVEEPVLFIGGANDSIRKAAILEEIETDKFPSGEPFAELKLKGSLTAFAGHPLSSISIRSFTSQLDATAVASNQLDIPGLHGGLYEGQDFVAINSANGDLLHGEVTAIGRLNVTLIPGSTQSIAGVITHLTIDASPTEPVLAPTTRLTVDASLATGSPYLIYYRPVRGARLVGAPKTHMSLADFGGTIRVQEKYLGDSTSYIGPLVVKDAQDVSIAVDASLTVNPHSRRAIVELTEVSDDATVLKAPLTLHGNFIEVDQGTTNVETLGSTTGARYQMFRLSQKPLTFLPQTESDPLPAIELYIDHTLWRYQDHLYGVAPEDEVYTLKLEADGQAHVILGGLPRMGNKNVVVRYRYATTGDNAEALTIKTLKGRIPGVSKVFNPFRATGGLRGDSAEDLRATLPARISANDRCVSAADYEVLARNFGALSASARMVWNPIRKKTGTHVTVIFEGGPSATLAEDLRAYLTAHAPEGSLVQIDQAKPRPATIHLVIDPASGFAQAAITEAITTLYFEKFTGLLAPRRIRIGHSYNRTELLGPLKSLPSVAGIRELTLDGDPALRAIPVASDEYLDADLDLAFAS